MSDELWKAAFDGDFQELIRLLDAGVNIDGEDLGRALHAAIENENLDCVQLLIHRGADIEHPLTTKARTTCTPLSHAVDISIDGTIQTGRRPGEEPTEIVNLLLAAGADPGPALKVAQSYQSAKLIELLTRAMNVRSA